MRIDHNIFQVLLDTILGSLSIGDTGGLWRYSHETRKQAANAILAGLEQEEGVVIGDPEPDDYPKEIEPKLISCQIVHHLQLGVSSTADNKALFYDGELVGFYDVYYTGDAMHSKKHLVKWERTVIDFPGKGIDTERFRVQQEESSNEGEIITKMLEYKYGKIKIVEE